MQKSPNPPAQHFHLPSSQLLNSPLTVRVGGSFTWPPPTLPIRPQDVTRLVLVAGGVGINPLISIFSHLISLHASQRPEEIHFLYGTKASLESGEVDAQSILFLPRLMDLVAIAEQPRDVTLSVFLTGLEGWEAGERVESGKVPARTWAGRIGERELVGALDGWRREGAGSREGTVAFVCGPQRMTDGVVEFLGRQDGMEAGRVLCEKWW